MAEPQLLTRREAWTQLRVSRATLDRLASTGQLRRIKIGATTRFRRTDLEKLISRHTAR
jgi:excisionase family DNA binding protein